MPKLDEPLPAAIKALQRTLSLEGARLRVILSREQLAAVLDVLAP